MQTLLPKQWGDCAVTTVAILHLEDDDLDADLVQQRILGELPNCSFTRVTDISAFERTLEREKFDLLLCDYAGPRFDGATALQIAREKSPDVPFLYISGVLGEENAIESLKRGATDYVLKQRLERLIPAVCRALEEAQLRRDRQRVAAALASSEERYRNSEQRFRQLADSMPQIVWSARADGYVDYYNNRWYEFTGFERDQWGDASWQPILHPADVDRAKQLWSESVRTGKPYSAELRFFDRLRNEHRWMLVRAMPIAEGDGDIVRWFGTCTDINDQKQIAEALRQSEEQLVLALSAARMGAWRLDLRTHEMTCSDACKANHGRWPAEPFTFEDLQASVDPEDVQRWKDGIACGMAEGCDFELEYRVRWPDQSIHWLLLRAGCARDAAQNVIALMGVSVDITERKRIEAQREGLLETERAARIESERIGRMKDEFLATLSHELRTPLNAILGWAQVLERDRNHDPSSIEEAVTVISRNARSQAQLINDLLDMSRIVSGKLQLEVEAVSMEEIVCAAIAAVRHAADAKSITVTTKFAGDLSPIVGDPNRLQQVLWNLLINAVKFTPIGGRVSVSLDRVGDQLQVRVSDTGEGISPDLLPHVFERFRQGDSSSTRVHSGLGLGLSLVKTLTELHGGTVCAQSTGKGKGATFMVSLPIAASYSISEYVATEQMGADTATADKAASIITPHPLNGLRILIVDDDRDARVLLERILRDLQADVTSVNSAVEGLEMLAKQPFDLIVSDIGMPGVDGYEFMREVRALPNGAHKTPAVALTAFARAEDRNRALNAGYQAHVPKPLDLMQFVSVVTSTLHNGVAGDN